MRSVRKFEEEKGKRYNYLTVLSESKPVVSSSGNKSRRWLFECECGKRKVLSPSNVFNGSTKSCGCKKKQLTTKAINKYYESKYKYPVERRMLSSYKKHGKDFNLSLSEFVKLVNSNCGYCGVKPHKVRFNKTKSRSKKLNGIDRVDSSRGYSVDNTVPCCTDCNIAKGSKSRVEFISLIKRIYDFNNNEK